MKKLNFKKLILFSIALVLILLNSMLGIFLFELRKMDNNNTIKEVTIKEGMSVDSILNLLIEKKLIRNKFVSKVYVKINNLNMQAGVYDLSTSMNTRNIIKTIASGRITNKYNVNITFKEGKNIIWYAKEIADKTNNTEEDVYNLLKDNEYIDSLIDTYWFLTEDIKKDGIYYCLEGYLYPETYTFKDRDVSVKDIFYVMLNQTNKVLSKYKSEIEVKNLNIHEFMTLASIVELEGLYQEDRDMIAGVFYNRLKSGWNLGSDVTTYYAVKKDMGEFPVLAWSDIQTNSPYNTRLSSMAGKLPIGPISNPSESSIKACINPKDNDYYYFVADCKNRKTVFTKTESEHVTAVNKIKKSGCEF